MHRLKLLELLDEYQPTLPEEITAKKEIIAFVNSYANCFERSLDIGHITASAWVLNYDKTNALLMHHAKLNKWVQLGGHCDGNADVLAVAIKEAQEESGINYIVPINDQIFDIDVHFIPANSREKEHYHYDIRFLLQAKNQNEDIVQNSESKELRWFGKSRSALPTNNNSVIRMFNKWLML